MANLFPILAMVSMLLINAIRVEGLDASGWTAATATSSDSTANPTGGACGYNIIDAEAKYAAAVSALLFKEGQSCGQCYNIKCDSQSGSKCSEGSTVTVVATSFFPPERALPSYGSDSQLMNEHFHLTQSAWEEISSEDSKVVPVLYQRVPCKKQGGVQFTINGQAYYILVLISNVAGDGSIKSVSIKGSNSTSWVAMSRNNGANWHTNVCFKGQSISFDVTLTDGQNLKFENVVPADWSFGQTYSSSQQFS
ncbi:Expansin [Rhynchospora pubera]|uniref:Expansin n=1 Tax=Rhynchospora pubera TaxID=906938 RepID=A0AAV8CW19_9POAL|nr:Expansin [Rhynchospora pubera]